MLLGRAGSAVAALLLTGCTSPGGAPAAGGGFPSISVDGVTVYLVPYESLTALAPDVKTLVDWTPVIIVGTVASTKAAIEVQPEPDAEGVLPGEGPDLYSTITFTIDKVIKGEPGGDTLTIGYESGKVQSADIRLAYVHEGLSAFQKPDATLRGAAEFAGRKFVVFAWPNKGTMPTEVAGFVAGGRYGVAALDGSAVSFGAADKSPVQQDGKAVQLTLDDLTRAAAK
jgi:hypothetical protein